MSGFVPNSEAQARALGSSAQFVGYGGQAGGGKTAAVVAGPMRAVHLEGFAGIIFRRELSQIGVGEAGSLWSEAQKFYPGLGGVEKQYKRTWLFPTSAADATIKFDHLEKISDAQKHSGKQYGYVGFDEAQLFYAEQVSFLSSRMRSPDPRVTPWGFWTFNPAPDTWLMPLVEPYLDSELCPHPDETGKVRWYVWGSDGWPKLVDGPNDTIDGSKPWSFTFIPATLADNVALANSDYAERLASLPKYLRDALARGSWALHTSENMFRDRDWRVCAPKDVPLEALRRKIRTWDLASQEKKRKKRIKSKTNQPDRTASALTALVGRGTSEETLFIFHVSADWAKPGGVRKLIKQTALSDGIDVPIVVEEETGASGKLVIDYLKGELQAHSVSGDRPSGDKTTRAEPWAGLSTEGRVVLVFDPTSDPPPWVRMLNTSATNFPERDRDPIDAVSLGYKCGHTKRWGGKADLIVGPRRPRLSRLF